MGQAVAADPAVPQAAERTAAASPYDQPVAVPAGRADQDRARVPPHDQRLASRSGGSPPNAVSRACHIRCQAASCHCRTSGSEGNGQAANSGPEGSQARPWVFGAAVKPTRVLWTADAAGVVTR